MKNDTEILSLVKNVLIEEGQTLLKISELISQEILASIHMILQSKGKVVVTGIGKSALIGQKIVATMNSTGQPAAFMHAADAMHGDLGIIQSNDIVICLSQSGHSPEIKNLVSVLNDRNTPIIAITGNTSSFLAIHSSLVLHSYIEKEACTLNLAPTNSSTAQLAIGDALAVGLMYARDFSDNDFARSHPGGALGKKLLLRVKELINPLHIPYVKMSDEIKTIMFSISMGRMGATVVVDDENFIKGIITDGDLRRMLNHKLTDIIRLTAADIMTHDPTVVDLEMLAVDALELLKNKDISQLIVTDQQRYVGLIHLHDILKEGISIS